ncbi:hypothetical protein [Dyella nitratireducens]|nr:hypothetical protein [Dyella nitratireducens]GLQ44144.1 hypothetical protein GCM10007902_39940 [Dyella nitratireducens]
MNDALAVISTSTDNIDVMYEVIRERANAEGLAVDDLQLEQCLPARNCGGPKSRCSGPIR